MTRYVVRKRFRWVMDLHNCYVSSYDINVQIAPRHGARRWLNRRSNDVYIAERPAN